MILDKDLNTLKLKDMKQFLKDNYMTHSFQTKEKCKEQILKLQNYYNFPWRKDQKQVLDTFLKNEYQYYVIQGLFGCGKTSWNTGSF